MNRRDRVVDQMVTFSAVVMAAAVLWVAYKTLVALSRIAFGG